MTRKEYRKHLNDTIGFDSRGKGKNAVYKARSRKYGDYLWHQDREMFEASYQEHITILEGKEMQNGQEIINSINNAKGTMGCHLSAAIGWWNQKDKVSMKYALQKAEAKRDKITEGVERLKILAERITNDPN